MRENKEKLSPSFVFLTLASIYKVDTLYLKLY